MATTLSVSPIVMKVGWSFASTTSFSTDTTNSASFSYAKTFSNGTGADASRYMYAAVLPVGPSSTTSLDLAGSLTDLFGNTITFAKVRVIYVQNASSNSGTHIKVGGAASNALANWITSADTLANDTPAVRVRSGGSFMLVANDATAYAVTAGTGDVLAITNEDASNAATVNVFICGE